MKRSLVMVTAVFSVILVIILLAPLPTHALESSGVGVTVDNNTTTNGETTTGGGGTTQSTNDGGGGGVTVTQPTIPDTGNNILDKITQPVAKSVEAGQSFLTQHGPSANATLIGLSIATLLVLLPNFLAGLISALIDQIPLLHFLLTFWVPVKRRRNWGKIIDSQTGLPIGGVLVQLHNAEGKVVSSYRPDQSGLYGFLIDAPGSFYLTVESPLYESFKSSVLEINDPTQIVAMDIILKPNVVEMQQHLTRVSHYLNWIKLIEVFSWIFIITGSIVSVYFFIQKPNLFSGVVIGLYTVIWTIKLIIAFRPSPFGQVIDAQSTQPLPQSVVQLSPSGNSDRPMVYSTITNAQGRYLFVVKPQNYQLIAAKPGYQPSNLQVDDTTAESTIRLSPQQSDSTLNQGGSGQSGENV